MSFSNNKRASTADKSKEEFMKLIAQEVRIHNKNNEEFQRVGESIGYGIENVEVFFVDNGTIFCRTNRTTFSFTR